MSAFERNSKIVAAILLFAGIFCSAWFRFHVANSDPLWLDELHSVWAVNRPIEEVRDASAIGNQAPLYFWALHLSHSGETNSPLSFRWLSIVCSVLTSISIGGFVWYWSRSLFAAALAVWLSAIDPNLIFYGSEARPYALLMLIAVWQFFAFVRCGIAERSNEDAQPTKIAYPDRLNKKWLVATIVLSAAMLLVHHTGILLLAAECLVVTVVGIWQRKYFRWVLISGSLAGVAIVVFANQYESLLTTANRRTQWNELSSLKGLSLSYTPQLVCLGVVPIAVLFTAWCMKKIDDKYLMALTVCVLACALLPAILAGTCDVLELAPLAMFRYTVVGAVALPIFAGLCVGTINHWPTQVASVPVLIAISIFAPIPERAGKQWQTRPANEFVLNETVNLFSGEPIRMRFESWDSVANLIVDSNLQIFLFANLLEDEMVDSPSRTSEFLDYLKFPLSHSGVITPDRILTIPSHRGISETHAMWLSTLSDQKYWAVIRGDPEMVDRIKSWLWNRCGADDIETYHFSKDDGAPEWLTVLKISFTKGLSLD